MLFAHYINSLDEDTMLILYQGLSLQEDMDNVDRSWWGTIV